MKNYTPQPTDPFSENEQELNNLNIIYYAMVGLPLLAFLYLYLNVNDGQVFIEPLEAETEKIILIILPVICLMAIGFAFISYGKKISSANDLAKLDEKMKFFIRASITKYAAMEFASLVAVLGYFLTTHIIFTTIYVAILLLFSVNRPTKYRVKKDLRLKQDERRNIFE